MNFEVGKLAEGLKAHVALIVHLPVLLLQGVRQGAVPPLRPRAPGAGGGGAWGWTAGLESWRLVDLVYF